MNRNTVKTLGLLLIVPSVFFGLMPYIVRETSMLDWMWTFHFTVAGKEIAQFHHDLTGSPTASSWRGVWIVAVVGELMLLSLKIFAPLRPDRFKIKIND